MYKKEQINEFNTYIKKFDRIVLSSSCLQKDKKSNNIINILIKEKKMKNV